MSEILDNTYAISNVETNGFITGTTSNFTIYANNDSTTLGYINPNDVNLIYNDSSTIGTGFFNGLFTLCRITKNLYLKESNKNFIVIPKSKIVISWSEESNSFVEYELNEFEHKLRSDNYSEAHYKNELDKYSNLFSILLKSDGNFYIDLEEDLYYMYSSQNDSWIKMYGEIISFSFSKNSNIKKIKENKKRRSLLVEKRAKLLLGIKGSSILEPGYVYAPYIPMITTDNTIGTISLYNNSINTTELTIGDTIQSRYSAVTINNNNYNTITI